MTDKNTPPRTQRVGDWWLRNFAFIWFTILLVGMAVIAWKNGR